MGTDDNMTEVVMTLSRQHRSRVKRLDDGRRFVYCGRCQVSWPCFVTVLVDDYIRVRSGVDDDWWDMDAERRVEEKWRARS